MAQNPGWCRVELTRDGLHSGINTKSVSQEHFDVYRGLGFVRDWSQPKEIGFGFKCRKPLVNRDSDKGVGPAESKHWQERSSCTEKWPRLPLSDTEDSSGKLLCAPKRGGEEVEGPV